MTVTAALGRDLDAAPSLDAGASFEVYDHEFEEVLGRYARLNSPNDVVVRRDGTIWFTDPCYGYLQGFRPEPQVGDYVYRFDPRSGRLSVVADSFRKPNGLAFSPDEQTLYITDSGANAEPGSYHVARPHHIVAFDVLDGRHLGPGRLFAVTTPGFPDGIKARHTRRPAVLRRTR